MSIKSAQSHDEAQEILEALRQIQENEQLRTEAASDPESVMNRLGLSGVARHAVALGGTVSAEHGLGKRKAHLLNLQYTAEQIESMKQVKKHLDPNWLLNRGNLFDE